jgi:hypothetical protein
VGTNQRADDHRWALRAFGAGLSLALIPIFGWILGETMSLAVSLGLAGAGLILGLWVPRISGRDRERIYLTSLGSPPPPEPQAHLTWRAVLVLAIVGCIPVAAAWMGWMDEITDQAMALVMLPLIGWFSSGMLREALVARRIELRVRREVEEGLHEGADLPGRALGVRDAWDSARPVARRWSIAAVALSVALWSGAIVLAAAAPWVFDVRDAPRAVASAILILWPLGNIALVVPVIVGMVWGHSWVRNEAERIRAMRLCDLVDYLNRAERPRRGAADWAKRLRGEGAQSSVFEVALTVMMCGMCVMTVWAVWVTAQSTDWVIGWALIPLYVFVFVVFLSGAVTMVAGSLRRRRIANTLDRLISGESQSVGETSPTKAST